MPNPYETHRLALVLSKIDVMPSSRRIQPINIELISCCGEQLLSISGIVNGL
jgi:hypothetical protein